MFHPNPNDPVTGFAPAQSGAFTDGNTNTASVYFFDTVDVGSRWQVVGGARWERYDTDFLSQDATGLVTADLEATDSLVSGKIGVNYRLTPTGNLYVSYGTSATPPGGANFALSAQANNANNPNVEPQTSANFEVGTKWDFANGRLSLNSAVFRTENKNVIFTVDATAVPPIFNQDDSQLVKGFTCRRARPNHGALGDHHQLRLPGQRAQYAGRREQRQPSGADTGILGQRLDDLRAGRWGCGSVAASGRRAMSSSTPPTRSSHRATRSSMAWPSTR